MTEGVALIKVEFMLTCVWSPQPAVELGTRWNSPAGIDTVHWLKKHDLIDEGYRATARGAAWVAFICKTPLPISKWVLPETDDE